jgi:hypothetical protein
MQKRILGKGGLELTADNLLQIEVAAAKISVQGNRYPDKLEELTGR